MTTDLGFLKLTPSQAAAVSDRVAQAKAAGPAALLDLQRKAQADQFTASHDMRSEAIALNLATADAVAALDAPALVDQATADKDAVTGVIAKLRAESEQLRAAGKTAAADGKSAHADSLAEVIAPPTT